MNERATPATRPLGLLLRRLEENRDERARLPASRRASASRPAEIPARAPWLHHPRGGDEGSPAWDARGPGINGRVQKGAHRSAEGEHLFLPRQQRRNRRRSARRADAACSEDVLAKPPPLGLGFELEAAAVPPAESTGQLRGWHPSWKASLLGDSSGHAERVLTFPGQTAFPRRFPETDHRLMQPPCIRAGSDDCIAHRLE